MMTMSKFTIKGITKEEDHNINNNIMLLKEMNKWIIDNPIELIAVQEINISSSNNPEETLWAEE
jgi:hypothetical protein